MLVAFCLSVAWAGEKFGSINRLMEKVHKGKGSPLGLTKTQLAKDSPAWEVIDKQIPAMQEMSRMLNHSKASEIKDAADDYADAVEDLAAAAKKKDRLRPARP